MKIILNLFVSIYRIYNIRKQGVKVKSNVRIGKGVLIKSGTIESGVRIMPTENIVIGENFYVNCYSHLCGNIVIGDNVLLGPKVIIWSKNHVFSDPSTPISQQGSSDIDISIEDDVWIGAGSIVLQGVTIGKGSVVGAGHQ